jgi:hypothetical protein
MTVRPSRRYPLLGTSVVDDRLVEFTWLYARPVLSLTFADLFPPVIGQVTHLDGLPRLWPAPDNLDWLNFDDHRVLELVDRAIDFYRRREEVLRGCDR